MDKRLGLSARPFRTRRGKIRLKANGAEIYQLPSAQEKLSEHQFHQLSKALANIKKHYTGKLDSFVLIAWDKDGSWICDAQSGIANHNLTLPEFAANAIRQDYANFLAAEMLDSAFD